MCMSGAKLPPFYVFNGPSHRMCETLNPEVPRTRVRYTDSAWMDELIFLRSLSWRQPALVGEPFELLLGSSYDDEGNDRAFKSSRQSSEPFSSRRTWNTAIPLSSPDRSELLPLGANEP
jgi:hypothetical protein